MISFNYMNSYSELFFFIGIYHEHVVCDACQSNPIVGMRWKCADCNDYDLCSMCYHGGLHSLTHAFNRIDVPKAE